MDKKKGKAKKGPGIYCLKDLQIEDFSDREKEKFNNLCKNLVERKKSLEIRNLSSRQENE